MNRGAITPESNAKLAEDILATQKKVARAKQQSTNTGDITDTESTEKQALMDAIKEVQKRAKLKHEDTNPATLKDYAIGDKWYNSRAILEQTATNILLKLATDTLPGIDVAKVAALQKALDDYRGVQTEQTGSQGLATGLRAEIEAELKDIAKRRRKIQLCADAEWPSTTKTNAGIRAEFKLPRDQSLS